MVSALDSGSNGPGFVPWSGHCVVFLGKTLHFHSASLFNFNFNFIASITYYSQILIIGLYKNK